MEINKESDLQKSVLQYLRTLGFKTIRVNCGGVKVGSHYIRLAEEGVSDIISMFPRNGRFDLRAGRFLAIETKLPYNKLSDAQKDFITWVNNNGGIAFCAKSLEDVIQGLKGV